MQTTLIPSLKGTQTTITAISPNNQLAIQSDHLLEEIIRRPVVILQRKPIVHVELLRLGSYAQSSPHFESIHSQRKRNLQDLELQ